MRGFLSVLLAAFLLFSTTAGAQLRSIPPAAKRAVLGTPEIMPFVRLGGVLYRLAPGGLIFDQENRTIVHGSLPTGAEVAYVTDMYGNISRIYILTAQERVQFVPKK